MRNSHPWLWDSCVGGLAGLVVAAIVAVNLIITVGIGYDVTLAEVFRQNILVGIATSLIFIAGPIVGILVARRFRRQDKALRQSR